MRYQYTYRTTARDLWQLSMCYTYGSLIGVCNIIFTAAMAALIISRRDEAGGIWKSLMVLGVCLFTVIQPLVSYSRVRKQAAQITRDTKLGFADTGIHVRSGGQSTRIPWSAVKKVSRKPGMIVVFSDAAHGFILPDRVLQTEKDEFYQYVVSKMTRK